MKVLTRFDSALECLTLTPAQFEFFLGLYPREDGSFQATCPKCKTEIVSVVEESNKTRATCQRGGELDEAESEVISFKIPDILEYKGDLEDICCHRRP
jgi:hypothetical protein